VNYYGSWYTPRDILNEARTEADQTFLMENVAPGAF
jgi:hypothetical protein